MSTSTLTLTSTSTPPEPAIPSFYQLVGLALSPVATLEGRLPYPQKPRTAEDCARERSYVADRCAALVVAALFQGGQLDSSTLPVDFAEMFPELFRPLVVAFQAQDSAALERGMAELAPAALQALQAIGAATWWPSWDASTLAQRAARQLVASRNASALDWARGTLQARERAILEQVRLAEGLERLRRLSAGV